MHCGKKKKFEPKTAITGFVLENSMILPTVPC